MKGDVLYASPEYLHRETSAHLFDLGDLPDTGATPVDVVADERAAARLSAGLNAIVHKALRRDPSERYATAAGMLQDMRAQLFALAPGYGRKEAAEDTERLISEASARRDMAEPVEAGVPTSPVSQWKGPVALAPCSARRVVGNSMRSSSTTWW